MAVVLALTVVLLVVAAFITYRRDLRRASRAEPQLGEARRAGFALTDAINTSVDVEAAARQAARAALAMCHDVNGEPTTDAERLRGRLEMAAAAADSAADHATALARRIRLHHSEIMRAAETSPLKLELLNLAGSEAMEYRLYAEATASSLDDVADEARRAAAEARARGSGPSP